jgi:peroxiredoxin
MRIEANSTLEPLQLQTLAHGTLTVPSARITHLQFRRFAGCPICNTRLRAYAKRVGELREAGIDPIVFFHTEVQALDSYRAELPFAVVADPGRVHYARFGVERSALAAMNLPSMGSALETMFGGGKLFKGWGAVDGLPAEFLVGPDGRVLAAKYGTTADDHWEIDEILALAKG